MGRVTAPLLTELAGIVGEVLGWTKAVQAEEVAALTADLATLHQVVLAK